MSSGGMYTQQTRRRTIEMSRADYTGPVAYARAKRGQVEMVTHLAPSWAPQVMLHSMHPGWVDTPGIESGIPGFGKFMGPLLRSGRAGCGHDGLARRDRRRGRGAGAVLARPRAATDRYLPGTGTDDAERDRLIAWLDRAIAPARGG